MTTNTILPLRVYVLLGLVNVGHSKAHFRKEGDFNTDNTVIDTTGCSVTSDDIISSQQESEATLHTSSVYLKGGERATLNILLSAYLAHFSEESEATFILS